MSKDDEIHMLSQPLMTPEGFVNPACLNALGAAIKGVQPAFARLSGDLEWSKKRCTSLSDITTFTARKPRNLFRGGIAVLVDNS